MAAHCQSKVPCTAAEVEGELTRFRGNQFDELSFPITVQAEALQVVHEVVTAGNAGKKCFDFVGALGTGVIELARHCGGIVARRMGEGKFGLCRQTHSSMHEEISRRLARKWSI